VALTVSALTQEKGIDTLIEAAALLHSRCPTLHWAIAGAGPERATLETRSSVLHSGPYVHFLGHLGDPGPAIAGATVLVVPSREEGFGSVILDALALGTPVVATRVGGIPEALAQGGGILVPPNDPAALAQAVDRLVGDPERRKQLSAAARQAARAWDLEPMVNRVAALYRSVKGVD
jgi:glycosyltransferase involved in cell wall biosynthesis